ncbi:hypothetical protein N9W96_02295 [Flavobacteriaceae bacterium]|nr:hypothetical protein [Flavobacteriaceae bacterium]
MSKLTKALTAAAGNAGGDPLYAEDVFSTYLYTGTGSPLTITNGIDLAGEGGLVWGKSRTSGVFDHQLMDTERGIRNVIVSNKTDAEASNGDISAFNSDGFSLSTGNNLMLSNGQKFASWTFRKAEKFFDVVTYSSDTTSGARTISHNLGSTPAFIIVKGTSFADAWYVYHIGTGVNKYLELNLTGAGHASTNFWGVTDSTFTVDGFLNNNGSTGKDYVAYLFASDAGGFGDDGDESIIKCGTYTGTGGGGTPPVIDLGFEPQWLLVKQASAASGGNWMLMDTMRGWGADGSNLGPKNLRPNTSDAEFNWGQYNYDLWTVNPTGFTVGPTDLYNVNNESGATFIYIAIRRPMKTPEAGTEVFAPISLGTTTEPGFVSGFVTDFTLHNTVDETGSTQISSRLTGNRYNLSDTAGTGGTISAVQWDFMDGSRVGNGTANSDEIQWMFKRARGFMDVVVETATQPNQSLATEHNLGVVPEFMISKSQNSTSSWFVYHSALGLTKYLALESSNAYQSYNVFGTTLTSTQFQYYSQTVGESIVNYLFATLAGVSKVGSYTGTGSDLNVDCGFSAGARWVMIKRSDISDGVSNAGDWYLWDSLRGIVAGNDPYLLTNTTAAQVTNTDYIDPLSSGFTVTSSAPNSLNKSGGTYIFLAIA